MHKLEINAQMFMCHFLYTLLCSRCGLLTRNLNQSTEVVFIFLCGGKNNLKN